MYLVGTGACQSSATGGSLERCCRDVDLSGSFSGIGESLPVARAGISPCSAVPFLSTCAEAWSTSWDHLHRELQRSLSLCCRETATAVRGMGDTASSPVVYTLPGLRLHSIRCVIWRQSLWLSFLICKMDIYCQFVGFLGDFF